MLVERVRLRDFRTYARAETALGPGLTVVHGRNGAGKTNLLEAVYFGCTGRSCRSSNDRDVIRFGAGTARVELDTRGGDGAHATIAALGRDRERRLHADGARVERLEAGAARPLVSVFLPDRLELVKGAPSVRRAHLDAVVAALWPARAGARGAYRRALAQRNALLARVRAGRAGRDSLRAWDVELACEGIALMSGRSRTVELLAAPTSELAARLGLDGRLELRYRPRSHAADAEALAAELAERVDADLERGFTGHGPHRDELAFAREGHDLRSYGSQGQQRIAVLALLLAERAALAAERSATPLMLLDDVMSELDESRREALVALLADGGQSIVSATELEHVPGAREGAVARIAVADGALLHEAVAA